MKSGVYPASVTPFDESGAVDTPAIANLLAWFRSHGCAGVVLAGTNGEGPSLSAVEKRDMVRAAVLLADGLEVILGVATSSLEEAVWSCKQAYQAGASAALVMPPAYYREASEEGIAQWFERLVERSNLPIIVYNFPQRTGVRLSPELLSRLAVHERIVGFKDSSSEAPNIRAFADCLVFDGQRGVLGYMGNEQLLIQALDAGWTGTISGAANVIPGWLSQIVTEYFDTPESARVKLQLIGGILGTLRQSPQPATNKAILHRLGVLPCPAVRLPLMSADQDIVELALAEVLKLTPTPSTLTFPVSPAR